MNLEIKCRKNKPAFGDQPRSPVAPGNIEDTFGQCEPKIFSPEGSIVHFNIASAIAMTSFYSSLALGPNNLVKNATEYPAWVHTTPALYLEASTSNTKCLLKSDITEIGQFSSLVANTVQLKLSFLS